MRHRFALLGAALVVASACGTRLPNSAFVAQTGPSGAANAVGDTSATVSNGLSTGANPSVANGALGGISSGSVTTLAPGSGGIVTPNSPTNTAPGSNQVATNSSSGPNVASDVGVTPTSITIGNVTGVNGPLGPDAFGPTLNGLQAFVAATNARGGVNGRKIILDTCDDGQDGAQNLACVQKLVAHDHVFAFLANNSLSTAPSAHYEYQQGVPDLGLPLNNGYYKYPNMFSIYGTGYVRDGTQTGDHGLNWNTTEVYRFFKQAVGVSRAAFFFYNEAASQSAAYNGEAQAKAEGIQIAYESGGHQGENIGAANFDADVLAMKSKNVDSVFDAVDIAGNQKICASMDRYGVRVKAKVSTIEVWSQDIGTPAWSAPCRDSIYVTGLSVPYPDTNVPAMARFRSDFSVYARGATLHQWSVDGYATGQVFVDGLKAMGPAPTRKGFIAWLDNIQPYTYTIDGLFTPVDWRPKPHPDTRRACLSAVQWQDSAGTFVTRSGPNEFSCYTVSEVSSTYTDDGS